MFCKVLIANRGEIAVRIIQTCQEMGICAVAVYSDADNGALHVQRADEAYRIGPAPVAQSYLSIDAIIDAAQTAGVDAVHPGYGFLAENADFARRVIEAGFGWIGPSPEVISLMGDKVAAKRAATAAGIPVVPGYDGDDQEPEQLICEAESLGYPIMIKAVAGGGGRGMRHVSSEDDLIDSLEGARREARTAFGDDRIFLEKVIDRPRHVEVQILADSAGTVVHLGERDCSLQRRHQKIVEESPSPTVNENLRDTLGDAAIRLARTCRYVGAGTVEFLVGGGTYYFLEMNTRIQVEHPVTEMLTGVDLIRYQIEVAAGEEVGLTQHDVIMRGHAIEARLYAEDPENAFFPSTGTLVVFQPPSGAGIRVDAGVYEGGYIAQHYDPMLAKVIVHAASRNEAKARMSNALERFKILGVTTNLQFLQWCLTRPEFSDGAVDAGFIDRSWPPPINQLLPPYEAVIGATIFLATTTGASGRRSADGLALKPDPWRAFGNWSQKGATRGLRLAWNNHHYDVDVTPIEKDLFRVACRETLHDVKVVHNSAGRLVLIVGHQPLSMSCAINPLGVTVEWKGSDFAFRFRTAEPEPSAATGVEGTDTSMTAPMPSTLVRLAVKEGQMVEARDTLGVLEAMKIEHVIRAPFRGIVRSVLFRVGDQIPADTPIARLEAS